MVLFPGDFFLFWKVRQQMKPFDFLFCSIKHSKLVLCPSFFFFFLQFRQHPGEIIHSGLAGPPQQSLSQYQVMYFTYQRERCITGILTWTNPIRAASLSVLFQAQWRPHTARPLGGRLPSSNLPPRSETPCPLSSEHFDQLLTWTSVGISDIYDVVSSFAKVSQQPVCVCVQGDGRCLSGMLKLTKVHCRILFSRLNKKKNMLHFVSQVNDAESSVALLKVNFYWLTAAGLNPQNPNFWPKAGFKMPTAATASICLTKINSDYI